MELNNQILIVDDNTTDRETLKAILQDDYIITEAANGMEALAKIEKTPKAYSLILSDIDMPVMDGYEFLLAIQAEEKFSHIPVIVMTPLEEAGHEVDALGLGAEDLITKPFIPSIVRRRVDNVSLKVIKEYERQEEALRSATLRLEEMVDHAFGGIGVFELCADNKMKLLHYSEGLFTLCGYSAQKFRSFVVDKDLLDSVLEEDKVLLQGEFEAARRSERPLKCRVRLYAGTGEIIWIQLTMVRFYEIKDRYLYHAAFRDITEEVESKRQMLESEKMLEFRSYYDMLTGIYNRETFMQKAAKLIATNQDTDYLLLSWDIDNFKVINDQLGRASGDRILKEIAKKLKYLVSDSGICGRFQADRFFTCIPGDLDKVKVIEKIVNAHMDVTEKGYVINIHFGVYPIINRDLPIDQMCDCAMLAVQVVKGSYSKCYGIYDDTLRDVLLKEQAIVAEMDTALEEEQFCVYYQPIYSVLTQKAVAAEALVRWQHPVRGMISPGDFIPIFERNGFVTKVDAYVWKRVCRDIRQAIDDGRPVVPVSVNLSQINFFNLSLCDDLIKVVEGYHLKPEMIKIEITESAYTDNPYQLLQTMQKLQNYGFQILMDDFGSGYSSLNMLKDVPVDILKIDMRFIDNIDSSGRAGNIVSHVVRMAKWLGMEVVSEGVETRQQMEYLRSIGCDRIQGFYYSRPLPLKDFLALLKRENEVGVQENHETICLDAFDFDLLGISNDAISILFNGMAQALAIYELIDGRLEIIRVNDAYYELMGNKPEELFQEAAGNLTAEDEIQLYKTCDAAKKTREIKRCIIRRKRADDHTMWIEMTMKYLGRLGKNAAYYAVITDVTKEVERKQDHYLKEYRAVLQRVYREVMKINYTKKTAVTIYNPVTNQIFPETAKTYDLKVAIDGVCQHLKPESRQPFMDFIAGGEGRWEDVLKVTACRKTGEEDALLVTGIPFREEWGETAVLLCSRSAEACGSEHDRKRKQ